MSTHKIPSTANDVQPESQWLADVFANHRQGLVRFVVGILRNRAIAEDVVQTAFAKAIESHGSIEPDAAKPWLYRVAFNEAVDRRRRLQIDQRAKQAIGQSPGIQSEKPDEQLVRTEQIEQVREALQELSPDEQQVVRLRIYEQQTFAQIAEAMELPLGTVLTRMRRALEKLRQKLRHRE